MTQNSFWNNKGLALAALERYEEAIICHDESIKLNPDFNGVWFNRAETYIKMNQMERTLEDFMKCLELNPKNESAIERIECLQRKDSFIFEGPIRIVKDSRDYCPRGGQKNYTNSRKCRHCNTEMYQENIEKLLSEVIELAEMGYFEPALMKLIRMKEKKPTNETFFFYLLMILSSCGD
ncbi:MAG: tetratricopeptide repeat protein [Promethearchaeota archaeon]